MALIHWYKLEEDGRDSVGDLHLYEYEYSNAASQEDFVYEQAKLGKGLSRKYNETSIDNNGRAERRLRSLKPFQPEGEVSVSVCVTISNPNPKIKGLVNFF